MTDSTRQSSPTTDAEGRIRDDHRVDEILTLLNDSNCRRILTATAEEALSADELSEECDIPLSTVYRKVQRLVDAQLLAERVRVSSHPQYTHEYALAAESLTVSLLGESGISLRLSERSDPPQAVEESGRPLSAD
jgi:DNA-binding transcriptional ArsR family regulator